jgi:hypothetical protein
MKNEMLIPIIVIIGFILVRSMPEEKVKTISNESLLQLNSSENITYNISLSVLPSKICAGKSLNGKIESNMPNENCVVYYKSDLIPFFMKQNIQLNSLGNYEGYLQIDYPVKAKAYVECPKVKSNTVEVEVMNC